MSLRDLIAVYGTSATDADVRLRVTITRLSRWGSKCKEDGEVQI